MQSDGAIPPRFGSQGGDRGPHAATRRDDIDIAPGNDAAGHTLHPKYYRKVLPPELTAIPFHNHGLFTHQVTSVTDIFPFCVRSVSENSLASHVIDALLKALARILISAPWKEKHQIACLALVSCLCEVPRMRDAVEESGLVQFCIAALEACGGEVPDSVASGHLENILRFVPMGKVRDSFHVPQ